MTQELNVETSDWLQQGIFQSWELGNSLVSLFSEEFPAFKDHGHHHSYLGPWENTADLTFMWMSPVSIEADSGLYVQPIDVALVEFSLIWIKYTRPGKLT